MKLSVFGQGKLGRPIADVLERHFEVARVDPALNLYGDFTDADAHIIIVPTPSGNDGKFLDDAVRVVLSKLAQIDNNSPVILMSTVMPGTCRKLQEDFPKHPIVYSPQFVDLGHVKEKFEEADFRLIGSDGLDGLPELIEIYETVQSSVYYSWNKAPVKQVTWEQAEVAKLAVNNFLALKLDYVNLIQGLCMDRGIDPSPVFNVLQADPRIGRQFMSPGFGHGGPCLTRDQRAIRAIAKNEICFAREDFAQNIADRCGDRTVILGITYKPNVPVTEDSHPLRVKYWLEDEGKECWTYDPLLDKGTLEDAIKDADTVVIGVPYREFDIDYGDRKVINPWGHLNA